MKNYWIVRVGSKSCGYAMDGKVFEKKREAEEYKKAQMPCSWSHHWHVVKLKEV